MASAGLQKAKKYKWKETNLALFGSDLEKEVKEITLGYSYLPSCIHDIDYGDDVVFERV